MNGGSDICTAANSTTIRSPRRRERAGWAMTNSNLAEKPAFSCISICRHARRLNDRSDAGYLALDQLLQAGRAPVGAFGSRTAKLDIACLHDRIIERLAERYRELGNDLARRAARRDHPAPAAENEIDPSFARGRHIRQALQPLRRCNRVSLDSPTQDLRDHIERLVHHIVELAGH